MRAPTFLCAECKEQWEAAEAAKNILPNELEAIRIAIAEGNTEFAGLALQKIIIELKAGVV